MLTAAIILPFMHIVSMSISSKQAISLMEVGIFPKGANFYAYRVVISENIFLSSLLNSVFYTLVITFFALIFNTMAAYSFSKEFFAKNIITYIFIIPMYFSGGLIPLFLLITRYLKWYNNYLAILVPAMCNVFYIIIMRSQIELIPQSLIEAAKIDGAKESRVLFSIVIPSITPTIAAISMFTALGAWNSWFPIMIYTNKPHFWNMQYYLRTIVFDKSILQSSSSFDRSNMMGHDIAPQNIQMAAIVLVTLPIVMVYPFVQKYFVKGMLLGAVKE